MPLLRCICLPISKLFDTILNMTVAFIGNRELNITQKMKDELKEIVENLIVDKNACTFLFGSRSAFNDLCFDTVTELKRKYIRLWRVYVRT